MKRLGKDLRNHVLEKVRGYAAHECPACAKAIKKAKRGKQIGARPEYLAFLDREGKRLAPTIARFLTKKGHEFSERVERELSKMTSPVLVKAKRKKGQPETSDAFDIAEGLLDYEEFWDWSELETSMTGTYQTVFADSARKAITGVKANVSVDAFHQLDALALDFSQERAAELVGKKILDDGTVIDNPNPDWAITETTRNDLRDILTAGLRDGASPQELASDIRDSFAFSSSRAEMVARTELAFSHMAGNVAGWKASEVVEGKQSILGSLHDLDDECDDAASDGVIGLDETFSNGEDAPPYHPNCVCDLLPVLNDESED